MLPLAILAGGLGTRLGDATASLPKSLVEVAGRPFIDHQLSLIARAGGGRRVVICAGHMGELIRTHVGDGAPWLLRVQYSFDGPELRGTAGALRQALPLLGEAFLVLYGDSYLDAIDYAAFERAFIDSGTPAMMSVYRNLNQWDRSNCLVAGGRILRYDKAAAPGEMEHIDYGLGALRAGALQADPLEADLAGIYRRLAAAGTLAAFVAPGRFHEIGSPVGREETAAYIRAREGN